MILVTGGSGLVGKELIHQLLLNGEKVRAIFNKSPIDIDHPQLEKMQCDILDVVALEEAMNGVEYVYHSAGFISYFPKEKAKLFKINVEGTSNIVNACLDAAVKKLVHVSSIAALGRPVASDGFITEEMDWNDSNNKNNYGRSKYLGELEVWRGVAEGLDAVIINPSLILGPGNWNEGSTQIFKSVYKELPWYTTGMNGFVDVRDVAKAMIMLMNADVHAQRFIVSANNENFQHVFNMIAKAFNKRMPNRRVTPFLAAIVWRMEAIKQLFTGIRPLVTKETAASAMAIQKFDNRKLKKFLPAFEYLPLQETITHTCNALQQKLNKR